MLVQRAQRAAEIVAADLEAQLDGVVFQPLVEGLAVEIAGALVEQSAVRLAVPDLSAASWLAPPWKAKLSATSGTACSRTSQASMPAGLTTRSIVIADGGRARRQQREPRAQSERADKPAS